MKRTIIFTIFLIVLSSVALADNVLLLHMDGDESDVTPNTVTISGDTILEAQGKYDGSISLDGTGDYLTIPDSDDFNVLASTTDDWTIDFWVKFRKSFYLK